MKRILVIIFLVILSSISFISCSNKKQIKNEPKFAIYLVKEEHKSGALSYGRNEKGEYIKPELTLEELLIDEIPLITEKDIKKYHWNTHEVELTKNYFKKHTIKVSYDANSDNAGSKLLGTKEWDAVVIIAKGKRIYCAGFPLSLRRSNFLPEILIRDVESSFFIDKLGNKSSEDVRNNKYIYEALKEANILTEK